MPYKHGQYNYNTTKCQTGKYYTIQHAMPRGKLYYKLQATVYNSAEGY